jgi:hypothetical protein
MEGEVDEDGSEEEDREVEACRARAGRVERTDSLENGLMRDAMAELAVKQVAVEALWSLMSVG